MTHISKNEFEALNWLPVKDRFNQSIKSIAFKYFTKQCPSYLNEVFELACPNNLRTRNSYLKLICPFRKTNMGQKELSFIGPSIWNKTPEVLRKTNSINTFKHNWHSLNRQKINYDLIIITIATITLLIICWLLS